MATQPHITSHHKQSADGYYSELLATGASLPYEDARDMSCCQISIVEKADHALKADC